MINAENTEKKMFRAVALKYSTGKNFPKLAITAGSGKLAEQIVLDALENDIEIFEDEKLLEHVESLNFLRDVPEQLYPVAAGVMEFVNQIDENFESANIKES